MRRKYTSSPLLEALCEFRFDGGLSSSWIIPGLLYDRIKDEYSVRKEVLSPTTAITETPDDLDDVPPFLPLFRVRFARKDESSVIQVGPKLLCVNHLRPYEDWETFVAMIEHALAVYKDVAQPEVLQRVRLRYLNLVPLERDVSVENLFNLHPYTGGEVPDEFEAFSLHLEIPFANRRDILDVGLYTRDRKNGGSIILDLDYSLNKVGAVSWNDLTAWLEDAHGKIQETFEAVVTDRLRTRFGEVK